MNRIKKVLFILILLSASGILTSRVYAKPAQIVAYEPKNRARTWGSSYNAIITEDGSVYSTADLTVGFTTYAYLASCCDREGNLLWEFEYPTDTYPRYRYEVIAESPGNKCITVRREDIYSNGRRYTYYSIIELDKYGNEKSLSDISVSYPDVSQYRAEEKDGYRYNAHTVATSFEYDDGGSYYLYEYYLQYIDWDENVIWEKSVADFGLTASSWSDDYYRGVLQYKVIGYSDTECVIYQIEKKYLHYEQWNEMSVVSVNTSGQKQWGVAIDNIGYYYGGSYATRLHENGDIQIANITWIYHIYPPTPDLTANSLNAAIGDNTRAAVRYYVSNSYGTPATLEIYVNNTLAAEKYLGTVTVSDSIYIDLGSVDGNIDIILKLISSGREIASQTLTVNKYNLLNNLDNYPVTNPNTFLIVNGKDRLFDDNGENQKLINDILDKGLNVFLIHDSIKAPLISLLEE